VPWDPTVDEARVYCSSIPLCGGFVYTTGTASVAAGGANLAKAKYCQAQSFGSGTASSKTGVGVVRSKYNSCPLQVMLPVKTTIFHGSLSWKRPLCVSPSRGLSAGSRDRPPPPNRQRQRSRPKKVVTVSGVDYEVGKELYRTVSEAKYRSIDGQAHVMQTVEGVDYYMPGAAHATSGPAMQLDGYFPLFVREAAAQWASQVGGGNGLAMQVGPFTTYGKPKKWSLSPTTQVYYMPVDGPTLYFGTYVVPFALDGYYPLYSQQSDAEHMSTDGAALSFGPASSEGHPAWWTTGQRILYYMPNNGHTQYFGNYAPEEKGPYETILLPTARQNTSTDWPPTFSF